MIQFKLAHQECKIYARTYELDFVYARSSKLVTLCLRNNPKNPCIYSGSFMH